MSDPIVVGVDGSPGSLRALRWAAAEAARRHVTMLLVHAFGIPDAFYGETMPPRDWLESQRARSQAILAAAIDDIRRVRLPLDISIESSVDSPIPLLLQRSESATMVVLGNSGRTVLGDLLVGSIAAALAAHARCPFAVVRGHDRSAPDVDEPVVVGVDGSPANEAAVGLAFEEASLRGAPLVAVHAWSDADTRQVFSAARATFDFEPLRESETRVLAEALAGWQEKYPDIPVQHVVERDRPRHQLLEWSTRAQLIVAGSRGRGGFTGLILGSTSYALIHHASCPVLLTPTR